MLQAGYMGASPALVLLQSCTALRRRTCTLPKNWRCIYRAFLSFFSRLHLIVLCQAQPVLLLRALGKRSTKARSQNCPHSRLHYS
ncbi:hypothetical protein PHLGIDRAFT_308496 [Phlebiopsis gigantea 11061_1 CR5-6]|uniref:Uncharacterized protein n=1 Tax=Phlebiopsis gigantea (strain 11061_1 CR5-6) TaxID=745531 RepID=A0A0C3S2U0_PHLG1|nr:hypothetical protein PHLGIDRAFT_308496 [Phlebiopsis gigantea 11061_1 CR5-6]